MASSSVTLHTQRAAGPQPINNPLPQLLQTPSGLALLELQGTINLPDAALEGSEAASSESIPIGRLDFPEYRADALDPTSTAWMKRAYMYVGQHQRLTGEVKKLPRPVAVVRRKGGGSAVGEEVVMKDSGAEDGADGAVVEDLEVVEIVKYKIVFSQRPEPVGTS